MKKTYIALILSFVLGTSFYAVQGLAQMGPGMMGWGYGMSWFSQIFMILFWVAVIVGIVFLIRWLILSARAGSHRVGRDDSALEILKRRYARGEIDKQEFEEKMRDLGA